MSQRNVDAIHLLAYRKQGSENQFLFYPHGRWSDTLRGTPFLALPTKKIPRSSPGRISAQALRASCAAVLTDDLGGRISLPPRLRRLSSVTLEMDSPTQKVRTTYTLWPLVVPVTSAQDHLSPGLRGEWLSASDALKNPELSPTAKRLFERLQMDLEGIASEESPQSAMWTRSLVAAQSGPSDLFGSLFEAMKPWLGERLLRCPLTRPAIQADHDVEDILQMAAARAWTHLKRFDPQLASASTWLWIVSRNVAVSVLRRRLIHSPRSLFGPDGTVINIADSHPDPATSLERREQYQQWFQCLERVLKRSRPVVREAWKMRYEGERSYAYIAKQLNAPVGTVATWIHKVKVEAAGEMGL